MQDFWLRTGIPSIDELFHKRGASGGGSAALGGPAGIRLPRPSTTSICISGPDGAGKSVLAMHIASRYAADCDQLLVSRRLAAKPKPRVWSGAKATQLSRPHVFYVSSDLTHEVAATMWRNFGLHAPNARRVPFRHPQFGDEAVLAWLEPPAAGATFDRALRVGLRPCPADDHAELASCLMPPDGETCQDVLFVDLASGAAGDDWAFVHRLLAALPVPGHDQAPHLLLLDAVEGLETFGGDMDAFGERIPRRARVAKLMRLAAGKCHVVLIIEEPAEGARLPEQFVADVVVRLRTVDAHGYLRRTIEIEKARGQPIVRGRHPYVVRSGTGSTTGTQPNADDPRVKYEIDRHRHRPSCQSYVDVFPSIHSVSRDIMEDLGPGPGPRGPGPRAGFGIHYLDQMLANGEGDTRGDDRGLPCGTVTALIGDAGTQKTGLGLAFLGRTFARLVAHVTRAASMERKQTNATFARTMASCPPIGVAVLLTTHDENQATLWECFEQHLIDTRAVRECVGRVWTRCLRREIMRRTICRRLEIHDTPPAVLLHTFKRTVEAAQQILRFGEADACCARPLDPTAEARRDGSWPIRLVVDDLSTIMDTYGQVKSDPLFLPFLLFYLRREGVTTLIEDTRPGGPNALTGGFHTDLRALSDHRVYTWHVDFYGDHRVAIAPIPALGRERKIVVRELRREDDTDVARASRAAQRSWAKRNLTVDPQFELYAGLEANQPRPVPLEVRLYAETQACRDYAAYLNGVFREVFTPAPSAPGEPPRTIVVTEDALYDHLRDFSFLQGNNRLDHTLVFQVDEFWTSKRTFRNERAYLCDARVATKVGAPDPDFDDPFGGYRAHSLAVRPKPAGKSRPRAGQDEWLYRCDFFDVPACDLRQDTIDRIPFARDFGFLVCREQPWADAAAAADDAGDGTVVRRVWEWVKKPVGVLGWYEFLRAARRVAEVEAGRQSKPTPVFDLSMLAPESFSCLVLEIWASEIYESAKRQGRGEARSLKTQLGTRPWQRQTSGLLEWVRGDGIKPLHPAAVAQKFPGYCLELYKTWLLLVEALDLSALQNSPRAFGFKVGREAAPEAVASRHWYKTASAQPTAQKQGASSRVVFCPLPGYFTTRGDWFLAVASGSRSDRLANRALDLLCSQRGNARRLRLGIGLPARRLLAPRRRLDTLSTALRTQPGPGGRSLTYGQVLALGAQASGRRASEFSWLWRSGLKDYHRHADIWQGWLYRVLRRWQGVRESERAWRSGFELYEEIGTGALSEAMTELPSFRGFRAACKALAAELEPVSE